MYGETIAGVTVRGGLHSIRLVSMSALLLDRPGLRSLHQVLA